MIEGLLDFIGDFFGWIVAIVLCGVISLYVYLVLQEQKQWDTFSTQHHCEIIGTKKGKANPAIVGGKTGVVIEPDETTYKCDDGKEYTR